MRRSSLAFMFVAGLSVGLVPIFLMIWTLSAQSRQARASEERLVALLQEKAAQAPFPGQANAEPAFTPIDSGPELAPVITNPPLTSGEPVLPPVIPQPVIAESQPSSVTSPENEAEEFVDKTRQSLQTRFQELQSEKKTLEARLRKIEKYSRLIKSLLAALDEKDENVPPAAEVPGGRTPVVPEPETHSPAPEDLPPPTAPLPGPNRSS